MYKTKRVESFVSLSTYHDNLLRAVAARKYFIFFFSWIKFKWCAERESNPLSHRQRIYSPPRLPHFRFICAYKKTNQASDLQKFTTLRLDILEGVCVATPTSLPSFPFTKMTLSLPLIYYIYT